MIRFKYGTVEITADTAKEAAELIRALEATDLQESSDNGSGSHPRGWNKLKYSEMLDSLSPSCRTAFEFLVENQDAVESKDFAKAIGMNARAARWRQSQLGGGFEHTPPSVRHHP